MYLLFLLVIFVFLLIGIYYYYFMKNILNSLVKNKLLNNIICILISIILLSFWFVGIIIKSILTPFMIYSTLLILLFNIIIILLKKYKKICINKIIYIIPLIISLIICLYGKYNINNQVLTQYDIKSNKKLNEDIKILFMSDCHYGNILEKENLDKFIEDIYRIKDIDLVLLGGDITDESTTLEELDYVYDKFSKIKNNYGIYFVYGNHDGGTYKDTYYDHLRTVLNKYNIKTLEDEYYKINNNIAIIGRKDIYYGRKELEDLISEDINNIYTILLDHQPKDYKKSNLLGIDLILSGHTHAGQIFPGGLLIDIFKTSEMSYGYKRVGNLNAIVSSGISGWRVPLRTEEHSEYVIINVKK